MAPVEGRNDAEVVAGLAGWLTHREDLPGLLLGDLRRPSAGYSSDTILVDATWSVGRTRHRRPLVIRMEPTGGGTFRHYDLVSQWQAQTAAAAAGVPVADPVVETDARWLGAPFMVMRRVDGHIIGALSHRDRWLLDLGPDDQQKLYRNFVAMMSRIHGADHHTVTGVPRRDNCAELDFWDEYLAWSSAGSPVQSLVDALSWCRNHRPTAEPPPALLWGDARFENAVIGDDLGILAVLDWDMTSIGAPEHDLAWFTSLDLTVHRLFGERLDAFPDRSGTIGLFEDHWGRPVRDLEWYETLAMIRSAAVMTRIGYLRQETGEPLLLPIDDNPVLDLIAERIR